MKSFDQLTEQELLALAISSEEEDGRIYADFAEGLSDEHPDTARVFSDMSAEENEHRRALIELYRSRFGNHIPLVRRQDVRGFVQRKTLWRVRLRGIEAVRQQASQMEQDARRFYELAASRTTDASIRILLGDLAKAELQHERTAEEIAAKRLPQEAKGVEDENARRSFILQIIQPGLVGDGWIGFDVSTGVCSGVCHAQLVECLSSRHGRVARRRNFNGICRSSRR